MAGNGLEALDMLRQERPDVLLADFAMPGLSGLELTKLARCVYSSLPVLFISGHADREALGSSFANARLLRKPFRVEELYELRRTLECPRPHG